MVHPYIAVQNFSQPFRMSYTGKNASPDVTDVIFQTCTGPKSKDCKACGSHYRPRQLSDGTFECKYESEHEKYRREEEEKKSKDEL